MDKLKTNIIDTAIWAWITFTVAFFSYGQGERKALRTMKAIQTNTLDANFERRRRSPTPYPMRRSPTTYNALNEMAILPPPPPPPPATRL